LLELKKAKNNLNKRSKLNYQQAFKNNFNSKNHNSKRSSNI